MHRLAVTRPASQLRELSANGALRNIEIVAVPLIATTEREFQWPVELTPADVDWVFFSSANGVDAFFAQMKRLKVELCPRTRFATVGMKTASALRQMGSESAFSPDEAYGRNLFVEFCRKFAREGEVILYARGATITFDPASLLAQCRMRYYPLVCYDTVPQPIDDTILKDLTSQDHILFTAPSAVMAYHQHHGKPSARLIAIGQSTASEMSRLGWGDIVVMKNADVDTILEYI